MKHTKGVLRAVERMRKDMLLTLGALISPHPEDVEKATAELSDIIAEETAQPELLEALKRMVALHVRMMRDVNHGASAYQGETIQEMNGAPGQAQAAIKRAEEEK